MRGEGQAGDKAAGDISGLLRAWSEGDQGALDRLTPIVYGELHRLARRYMRRERPGHSLQTTALIHEAYLRLADYKRIARRECAHFLAVSAQVMRRILVEQARRRNLKRGDGLQHVSVDEAAAVVEMRFFGGRNIEETAEVLKVSAVTVKGDGRAARDLLHRELAGGTA